MLHLVYFALLKKYLLNTSDMQGTLWDTFAFPSLISVSGPSGLLLTDVLQVLLRLLK